MYVLLIRKCVSIELKSELSCASSFFLTFKDIVNYVLYVLVSNVYVSISSNKVKLWMLLTFFGNALLGILLNMYFIVNNCIFGGFFMIFFYLCQYALNTSKMCFYQTKLVHYGFFFYILRLQGRLYRGVKFVFKQTVRKISVL